MIGVYGIKNRVDGNVYIGGTAAGFDIRWRQHVRDLKAGKHANKPLQNAWNEYGENAFVFEVIEVVDSRKSVSEREQHWINKYYNRSTCYNRMRFASKRQENVDARTVDTRLTQNEAARVKTEFETKYGAKVKYRELFGYSPREIAGRLTTIKVKPEDVAKAAGRQ